MEQEFKESKSEGCSACGGPYHPASGHVFEPFPGVYVPYCGACYRPFLAWMKGHLKRKWSGANFYEEAAVSCSARPRWSVDTVLK